jgi:sec-independent protein translocase protein TatC
MTADHIDDSTAPLVEHLAELRTRLLWSVAALVAAIFAVYPLATPIFNFLSQPLCIELAQRGQECTLQLIKPQEGFFVAINISIFGGLIVSFPVIAYQMWRFVAPGLYKSERNAFLPFLVASPAMFFLGAAFAFYFVLPVAYSFFLNFQQLPGEPVTRQDAETARHLAGVVFQGSMQEYLGLTMKFILAFGLCFQMPVLLTLMGKAGLISAAGLASVRKYAFVVILILAAVATPPDVISQVMLFAAIYPLYEVSILLIRRIEKAREARLRAEGLWVDDEEDADLDEHADDPATPAKS